MPALKNARQEAFCRNLAHKQMTLGAAYKDAGFKPNKANAARLARRPEIKARIAELQEAVANKTGWTAAKRLKTLEKISGRNETKDPRVTIAAIAEANAMQGSYPPKRTELTGKDGGPVQHVDLSKVSDEDLDKLEAIFGPLAAAGDDETEGGV